MAGNKITLAIFDFDGTLTEGHLWSGIARHHKEKKVKRRALYFYLVSHMPIYLASKARLISEETNRVKWGEGLSILFKGFTGDEAGETFAWIADNYFMPLMRPDMIQIMKEHQKQGHKVMLLSGMFVDFLNVIGKRLDANFAVGTRLEKVENRYSGRIIPPLCFGENKAKLLSEFIRQKKLNVDFKQSSAYADSISDIPVLRMVGNPVATYPDKELFQEAHRQKWQIIGR